MSEFKINNFDLFTAASNNVNFSIDSKIVSTLLILISFLNINFKCNLLINN